MYIVITYDIQDDQLRNRISQLLLDVGLTRVQKSVFEGIMPEDQFRRLQTRLHKLINPPDSVRYYNLCNYCRGNITVQGADPSPSEDRLPKIL